MEGTTPSHDGRGRSLNQAQENAVGAHPLGAGGDVGGSDGGELGL
jgi:hypothetical protein